MNFDWLKTEENTLIYIGDTMCSWCYGFANELDRFVAKHPELKLHLVMGGLRPNNTEKAIDMADFLKKHWVEINERTGQPFSYEILSDPEFIYDTEPATRAVIVARMMDPKVELDFFKATQIAFYKDNVNTNEIAAYLKIAESLNLNTKQFSTLFESEEARYYTKSDFQLSAEMGIKGFPSVVLKKGREFIMLSNGYRTCEDLEVVFNDVMSS